MKSANIHILQSCAATQMGEKWHMGETFVAFVGIWRSIHACQSYGHKQKCTCFWLTELRINKRHANLPVDEWRLAQYLVDSLLSPRRSLERTSSDTAETVKAADDDR